MGQGLGIRKLVWVSVPMHFLVQTKAGDGLIDRSQSSTQLKKISFLRLRIV